jgi:putative ABC transport system substrate-binding protein
MSARAAWIAIALCAGVATGTASAQDSVKPIRIGVLLSGSSTQWSPFDEALAQGLRERGYVEGKNIVIVRRYGELNGDRIRSGAVELASMKLDTIVTSCTATTRSAAAAAPAMPIVIASIGDPVLAGLVTSLAHPGGNITGRASLSLEIIPKRLELLRDVLAESSRPAARIAILLNSKEPTHRLQWESAIEAAKALQLELVRVDVNGPGGLTAALDSLPATGARGLFVFSDDPGIIENRVRISEAAIRYKLPLISGPRIFAAAGALISYGMDMTEDFRQSAAYVVKVSNGTKPADLPIERPTKIELTVNQRTAAAIGIKVPREVLLRANAVIE